MLAYLKHLLSCKIINDKYCMYLYFIYFYRLINKVVINQVISYWPSDGSSVGCIGPRNYLINNIIVLSVTTDTGVVFAFWESILQQQDNARVSMPSLRKQL